MPSDQKKLPVLYIHGIQSHPGWFYGSARALADAGHTVYQVTRRGSGDNTEKRGHAPGVGSLYSDINICICQILIRENVKKVHLVGVSWGGKLAAAYASKKGACRKRIASITLLAPGIASQVDAPLATMLGVALCMLSPIISLAPFIGSLVFRHKQVELGIFSSLLAIITLGLERVRFKIPLSQPELFTLNPKMQEYLLHDQYRLHRASARFMFASRLLDWKLKFARKGSITSPTTLILANDDRIIDNDETEHIVARLADENLKVVRLTGSHTLEFEPNPQPFFSEIVRSVERGEL